uniref:TSA: Wollemia nobilis Ref_Wollemi_Transcript_12946_2942 transcribed RNA sequence n=1 Tax=Wollemia nobilis TaxID=56998 RepID=A0A0C9S5C5_9CONI
MQSGGGQYGVPGMQQFMVEGCTPHGFFAALSSPPPQDGINQHHGNNHHPHLQQQQQIHLQQSFQNQRVQHLQHQQQLGGLQAPAADSPPELRTRDLNGKRNKIFGLREGGAGNGGDSIQGVQDHPHPVAPPPPPPSSSHVVSQQQQQQNQPVLTDDDGEGERSGGGGGVNRWPREETLALLRIRSQMDSNFRDSNIKGPLWENVSRKLAELGYQRSAKKCKEKFENINKYYKKTKDGRMGRQDGKSYRFFSELEALSARNGGGGQGENHHHPQQHHHHNNPQSIMNMAETSNAGLNLSSDNNTSEDEYNNDERTPQQQMSRKKRKRKQYMSSMAVFFESLVKQLMEHQEELHRKFLEAIERRDQERLNREEAWRRQEMARLTRETELREQEHALRYSREAALVALLQKITGEDPKLPTAAAVTVAPLNSAREDQVGPSYETNAAMQEQQERDGMSDPCIGKRWPKPEVHALIRLRSGMEGRFQEPGVKGPLWEEISSGMAAQGFHRSAKRCKEKWENINKYFRKTKDSMKKRPENAKTCPYFHELGVLYGKGVLTSSSAKPNNKSGNASDVLMIDQGGEGDDDDNNDNNNNNNNGEDEEQAQARSDSELLAMIPAEQTGIKNNGTNDSDQFFHDDHRVDQSQKRMKINNSNNNQPSNSVGLSFELGGGEKLQNPDEPKKGNKMERLVKELLEMQQQKFLDDFERREHRQDRQQSMGDRGQEERQRQQGETQEEPQSALMALVHKFAVHAPEFDTQ